MIVQEHTSLLAVMSWLHREAFISCSLERCRDLMAEEDGCASLSLCLSPVQISMSLHTLHAGGKHEYWWITDDGSMQHANTFKVSQVS